MWLVLILTRKNCQLKKGYDKTNEISRKELRASKLFLTTKSTDLKFANCYIITVPTPIDNNRKPDLKPILKASKMVAKLLKKKDLVIKDSTV